MNKKLSKFSNEQLEQRLVKMEKDIKKLNWVIIVFIILNVVSFLLKNANALSISPLVFALAMKYIMLPMNMGAIKTEISNRNAMNIETEEVS